MFTAEVDDNYEEESQPGWKGRPVAFDGDQIAYVCAAGAETRGIKARLDTAFSTWKEYSNRTEFYAEIGKANKDQYLIEDVQYPFKFEKCAHSIDDTIRSVLNKVETKDYVGYIAEGSPRDAWMTMKQYKGNRKDTLRPAHLKQARQYLVDHWGFEKIDGTQFETDDMVCIRGASDGYIMFSQDKDSRQTYGTYMMLPDGSDPFYLDGPTGWFDLDRSGKTPKPIGSGMKFLAYQCLCGDKSDNYDPKALIKVKFGPVAAKKILDVCTTEQEVWAAVAEQYKTWFPQPIAYTHAYTEEALTMDWAKAFDEIFRAAWMARNEESPWVTGYEILERYGIEY